MYSNILVPVIFDDGHDTQASYLAARALADEGAKFTVLHVMETIPAYVAAHIPDDVFVNSRAKIQKSLKQSAAALLDAETVLISGHAGRTIVDYSVEYDIDCIVMASHRPGIEDFFLGSTAGRVVRHSKCSVHVIR
jgi:universal stress protein F